jgi:hypothetical protein
MGGHIKEGLELIRTVLAAVGFTLPAGPKRALLSLLLKRLQIRMRGLNFTPRDKTAIPETQLFRMDICWALAAGLGAVDLIRGADFHGRHLLLALRSGESFRIARALSFEAAQTAARGGPAHDRAVQIAHRAEELSRKVGHPHPIALAIWARGIAAYLVGGWKKGAELCEEAAEILRDRCTGVTWELSIAQRFMLSAMLFRGEVAEVSRRVPFLLSAALEQGNVFASTDLRTRLNMIWLAADDPDKARAEVIEALKQWPHEGFHLQHYSSMLALVQIELYTGDAEVAWKHIQGQWKALEGSMLLRIQILRIEAMHLKARAALASIRENPAQASQRLKIAANIARRISKEQMAWATPLATLLRAGIAYQRNDLSEATANLSEALNGLEIGDMHLYAAATRRRLGEVMGGERGERLVEEADRWMRSQKIRNPVSMSRMLVPGFES